MFIFVMTFLLSLSAYAQIETADAQLYQISPENGDAPEKVLNKYGALEEMHFQFLKDYSEFKDLEMNLDCKVAFHFQEKPSHCTSKTVKLTELQQNWPKGTEIFIETDRAQEGQTLAADSDYSWTAFPPSDKPVKFYGSYNDFLNHRPTTHVPTAAQVQNPNKYWKWAFGIIAAGLIANEMSNKKVIITRTW